MIEETGPVSVERFQTEVQGRARPLVLRGQFKSWPAVRLARESPPSLFQSLLALDDGTPVGTMIAPPEVRGRFFYNPAMDGVNFERRPERLSESIGRILELAHASAPPAVYVGAIPLVGGRARFSQENPCDLLGADVAPRIWLSNAATVQTHLDMSENLACVVCGTRRFTLFPTAQIANLYVGPLDFTLAGQPVSLARLDEPEDARFPKFRAALAAACHADLEPGDALYIPYMWWHHVTMNDPLNVLVNYWWARATPWSGSPFDCLVHAIAAIRALPEPERSAWQAVFAHYIFGNEQDVTAHIPAEQRGILGTFNPPLAERIRLWLLRSLQRR